ncbi:RTX-I toxin determinant A from serotypes 1/9 [Symmachiella macrocystis]|uniref:RTX-I toxin determinant A from serotypes 1/9 n=1 Tax=Symmachiella macrocystis TaxID=2527985 RepID=A0A5C6B472_9PLAN|nr:calcium-binding protein [Symmachiella macrocystis]TWU05284.1 RTX-I toxin determinant A from serotypes 1/9 [Symmachiella macrocystis]
MTKRANNKAARRLSVTNRSSALSSSGRGNPFSRTLVIENLEDRLVLSAAPPIIIDGNFDDWDTADYAGGVDPAGDPHDTDHTGENDVPALVDHPDVDLLEYRVTHDAENLYFYFRAAGEIGRTQDSSGGERAGRYYVIVTIDVDNDVNTGYPLHEGGYYPTTSGYDMNAEIEFYDGEFNTGHYLSHGALDEEELYQAFLDQTSGEFTGDIEDITGELPEDVVGPYTPGFVDVRPGVYEHYTQWVYQEVPLEGGGVKDQIILVQDKGPVYESIITQMRSPDGHELEMKVPLKGFLVDPDGNPIISADSILNLSFSLEASGELANGTPQNPNGEWASDTGDPIVGYSMFYNATPMVELENRVTDLFDGTDTTSRVKVADIVITDDAEGVNELTLTGADADLFEIIGDELFLKAGTVLDSSSNPVLDVTVNVDDGTVGSTPDDSAAMMITVNDDVNDPPMVALDNTVTILPEDTDTTSRVKVADIVVTDDALGTNVLSLSGADAGLFEIVGDELFLKAGTVLDIGSNPVLDVIVDVDDDAVGTTPDDSAALAIQIADVNDPPIVGLGNAITSLLENTDTTFRLKVADIAVSDDGLGVNVLYLTGADANLFEIIGDELFLKAGTILNYDSNPILDVVVNVDDASVGSTPDDSVPLSIFIVDVNDPPMVTLDNTVDSLPERIDTTFRTKVADIVVTDDTLGDNELALTGADANLFEILGTELFLKAGAVLDSDSNPVLSVTVTVDDVTVGTTPDATVSLVINVIPFVNTRPVADAGGPYVLGNRDRIQLDGSGSFDVDQPANTLTYLWDYGNDGTYDAVGVRPYITAADLNGKSNIVVRLKVVDDEGASRSNVVRVFGEDTAVLRIRGDYDGVVGQRRVVSLKLYGRTVTDGQYTYTVDWGDGSKPRVVTGISGLSISKIYNKPGTFTISATAVNNETGLNTSYSRRIRIGTVQQQGDDFAVSGTNARDEFRVVTLAGSDRVEIFRNRISLGVHTVPGTIYAMGMGGDDWFRGDHGNYDVYFDGGRGNNVSYTYYGNDTILGRDGRDRVYDYGGDNYVSVGDGNNVIKTNIGDDYVKSGSGDDTIIDFGGNNMIDAGDGDNDIDVRKGNDVIITGSGQDQVNDLGGHNYIEVGDGSNVVRTGIGNDTILGGAQDDNIRDDGGFNTIYTFAGNDFIIAFGSSFIDSGSGDDFVFGQFRLLDDDDDLFTLLARSR